MHKILSAIEASLQPLAQINKSPYITDVTTFPSITVLRPETERLHTSSGAILKIMRTKIRGYVRDEHPTAKAELLARQAELILQTMVGEDKTVDIVEITTESGSVMLTENDLFIALEYSRSRLIDDIRVVSVMTDDGILRPYGMCELGIEVQWYEV